MAEPIPRPDWCTVGATAYTLRSGGVNTAPAPSEVTIDRITATTVKTSDGRTWRGHDLIVSEGGSWGWRVALLAPDDPAVVKAREKAAAEARVIRARNACHDYIERKRGAAEVILALAPLTGVEDEIRALFDRTAP